MKKSEYKKKQEKIDKALQLLKKNGIHVDSDQRINEIYAIIGFLTIKGKTKWVKILSKMVEEMEKENDK